MTGRQPSRWHDVYVATITATAVVWAVAIAMLLTDNTKPVPPSPSGGTSSPDPDRAQRAAQGSRGAVRSVPPTDLERVNPPDRNHDHSSPVVVPSANPQPVRSGGLPAPWDALAACESSGDPHALSPGGTYRGLFQFSMPTWASVGGSGDPAQASVAEQLHRARILQARSGWGQWPQCAAQLGLT